MGRKQHLINGIRIRLARHGIRNQPVYHIVAIAAVKGRNARPLEKLGEYDPIPRVRDTDCIPNSNRVFGREFTPLPKEKTVSWDLGRVKWWIANGARPTETVIKLLERVRSAPRCRRELCRSCMRADV
jgi:small subunit ribosomal protein S16